MSKESKSMKNHLEQVGFKRLIGQYDGFAKSMGMPIELMNKMDKQGLKMNTMGGRMGIWLRTATHGLRGFRMEMLGVMFFGMMLQKSMFGLLRPAAEAMGMFELWQIMLQVLFLPIMIELLPLFLELVGYFISLSNPIKELIGVGVILAGVFGMFLMLFGQMALGLGSVIQAFGNFVFWLTGANSAGAIFTGIAEGIGLSLSMLAIIAVAVTAVLVGMIISWKENFMGFRKFRQVVLYFVIANNSWSDIVFVPIYVEV